MAAQLKNRQRQFWLLNLPQGDQAREIVFTTAAIGRRLTETLAYADRTESTVSLDEPETLGPNCCSKRRPKPKPK